MVSRETVSPITVPPHTHVERPEKSLTRRSAWSRMQPLYPRLFRYENGIFINPWKSVTRKKRRRKIKPIVDR